jgi:PAS domain S-box-containing protein
LHGGRAALAAALLDVVRDPAVLMDRSGTVVHANAAFCDLTGFEEHELLQGGDAWPWIPEEERGRADAVAAEVSSLGRGRHPLLYRRRDGERFAVLVDSQLVLEDEVVVGVVFTARRLDAEDEQADLDTVLGRVGAAVARRRPASEVFDLVVRETMRLCGADSGAVLRLDGPAEGTVLSAIGQGSDLLGRHIVLPAQGSAARAAATGKPAHVTGYTMIEDRVVDPPFAVNEAVALPIVVGPRTWGVLVVARTHDVPLRPPPLRSLERVAQLAAAAVPDPRQRTPERVDRTRAIGALGRLVRLVDERQPFSEGHARRVARLATSTARRLGWPPAAILQLEEAALLHDVGMLRVSDALLCKPSAFTDVERAAMQEHAALGAELLADILPADQVRWIRHHHERHDGGGYPDGLAAATIPDGAAILAAAEVWDALSRPRPYRTALDRESARAEIRRVSGVQLAPAVAEALLAADPTAAPGGTAISWPAGTALTARQIEILRLLDAGVGTDEIAARLHLTRTTVRNHVARLLHRLDAHSRLEALARARGLGILS